MKRRHRQSTVREQTNLRVRSRPGRGRRGAARTGQRIMACALGSGGIRARKREGDGATPAGRWRLVEVLFRADRVARPVTALPVRAIATDDGWCDAPEDRNYNRAVTLPYPASAERLWREDHIYDIVVVLDHNSRPRARGLGSAVFLHLARDGFTPTEGCVALSQADMRQLLARCGPGDAIAVQLTP